MPGKTKIGSEQRYSRKKRKNKSITALVIVSAISLGPHHVFLSHPRKQQNFTATNPDSKADRLRLITDTAKVKLRAE